MVRTRSLSRVATRLVAILPFTGMFAASCGPSGTSPTTMDDAGSAPFDGAISDAGVGDGPSDAAALRDASNAGDTSAFDGQVVDAGFVTSVLGSADRFAIFSGAVVENAAGTVTTITGDLGTYPSSAAIGLTPAVVVGTEHLGDGVAAAAAADIQIAYDRLLPGTLPCGTDLTGADLGGETLVPGVYCFATTVGLTGTLTLDAQNKPDAVWVFQVGTSLTTASGSRVVVINGAAAQACNAFWQIGSAATIGTNSTFGGNILAYTAITLATGTTVVGRTFGLTAKVTTDSNVLSIATCPLSASVLDGGSPDGG